MWAAKYLGANTLSEHLRQARGLTWRAWRARCPARDSVLEAPGRPSPRPLASPLAKGPAPAAAPSPHATLCFPACPSRCTASRIRQAEARWPTWKRKRGRCPPAGLATTRCETSGYNTGPGRCSDPSCLVLQPEGRRSAAEPATPSPAPSTRGRGQKAQLGRR